MSNSSIDKIWNVIRIIKSKVSFDLRCTNYGLYFCYDCCNDIKPQVDALQIALKTNATDIRLETTTKEFLKTASEMFLYLNSCSKSLNPWFLYYMDLFKNQSPDQIILTLNRIMKTNKNQKMMSITKKLFNKLNSVLSLKYQDIENLIQGNMKSKLILDGKSTKFQCILKPI